MGGEGYAQCGVSDTALGQLESRENLARSDLPRRSPSVIYEGSRVRIKDCMEMVLKKRDCYAGVKQVYERVEYPFMLNLPPMVEVWCNAPLGMYSSTVHTRNRVLSTEKIRGLSLTLSILKSRDFF